MHSFRETLAVSRSSVRFNIHRPFSATRGPSRTVTAKRDSRHLQRVTLQGRFRAEMNRIVRETRPSQAWPGRESPARLPCCKAVSIGSTSFRQTFLYSSTLTDSGPPGRYRPLNYILQAGWTPYEATTTIKRLATMPSGDERS